MTKCFRVGIVGLSAQRGWAATAHIPALRAMSDVIEIAGVATTSLASAQAAAAAFDIPRAFSNVDELVASPDIDIVIVTVKVAHHREVVKAALEAGKSVYCEWPLGHGLAESIELAGLARGKQARAVIGTQAVASPAVELVRKLVAEGYVGDVLSSTYIGSGMAWGDDVLQGDVYAMDARNGATLLSIIGGHALAAVTNVLGPISELGAILSQRRQQVRVIETGEVIPLKTHDHVMVNAIMQSGAPLSLQLRGGIPRGTRLLWEINGTMGDLRITSANEHVFAINITPLRVEGARKGDDGYQLLEVPPSLQPVPEGGGAAPRNVASLYRFMIDDLTHGSHKAPDFDDAVALHQILDAIERSDRSGERVRIG